MRGGVSVAVRVRAGLTRSLLPPDPRLAGVQVAPRPFRVSDAAAVAESSGIPTYRGSR
jgi:hypothetical protein